MVKLQSQQLRKLEPQKEDKGIISYQKKNCIMNS